MPAGDSSSSGKITLDTPPGARIPCGIPNPEARRRAGYFLRNEKRPGDVGVLPGATFAGTGGSAAGAFAAGAGAGRGAASEAGFSGALVAEAPPDWRASRAAATLP